MTTLDIVRVDELRLLEAEAVHIIREVVAELQRPRAAVLGGTDSIVLLRLAEKAFRPSTAQRPHRRRRPVRAAGEPRSGTRPTGGDIDELVARVLKVLNQRR